MDKNNIQLELTVSETNTVLAVLGQQPYIKVAGLIEKIQQQGASQLKSYDDNSQMANSESSKISVKDGQ
ncbi:hypothetical protein [Aquimarina algiphila]|uniref:Uncharacterized protein n=1 Tax=Aquimarina algiphila TaxID=2047982 RepID=A0A554VN83_9FLAO|nr:hypothetical protein [Aquimarina algiphila]TSE09821.1 hypothetical protein FOF46_07340 [Aquimarina algiphila]